MQIYGLFSNSGLMRPAASGAPTSGEAGAGASKSSGSVAALLGAGDESATERAARAKQKLDEIKGQLRMLRFWSSDPETLARLAKQLAQQLGAVAQQLAGTGAAGGSTGATSASGAVSGATSAAAAALADVGNAQADAAQAAEKAAPSPDQTTFAERAYREFDGGDEQSDFTARVAAELKSVAEQLKQLLKKAEQELRAKNSGRDADDARSAANALSAAVGQLGGTDATAPAAVAIPTSISV